MNSLGGTIPDFLWPVISMILGYALGAMFFTFLVLHSLLKDWTQAGGLLRKIVGYTFIFGFALIVIAGMPLIPRLVFSSHSNSGSMLGSIFFALGTFSTIFALYMTPSSYFSKAKNKIYKRKNADL